MLALDVGERRIGVAVSDPLGITAQSVDTIHRTSLSNDLDKIAGFLAAYNTDRLLLGLPSTLSGEEGMQARITREFSEHLTARGWQVRFYDERMTTAIAHGALHIGCGEVCARLLPIAADANQRHRQHQRDKRRAYGAQYIGVGRTRLYQYHELFIKVRYQK